MPRLPIWKNCLHRAGPIDQMDFRAGLGRHRRLVGDVTYRVASRQKRARVWQHLLERDVASDEQRRVVRDIILIVKLLQIRRRDFFNDSGGQ